MSLAFRARLWLAKYIRLWAHRWHRPMDKITAQAGTITKSSWCHSRRKSRSWWVFLPL